MFKWLRNIFIKFSGKAEPSSQKRKKQSVAVDPLLDARIKEILAKKDRITNSGCPWYTVHIINPDLPRTIAVFTGDEIKTDSLLEIKSKRVAAEEERIKKVVQSARYKLAEAKVQIQTENVDSAESTLSLAYSYIKEVKNQALFDDYRQLRRDLSSLRDTLRRREIERQDAERKAREVQERKRREEEERLQRQRRLEQKRIEEQKEKERKKYEAELLAKEKKDQKERERLAALSSVEKGDAEAIKQLLVSNGITYLYHFTPRVNLQSIRNHGGLFSWKYCETHSIKIPAPGGDMQSRGLDQQHGLEDYVRLSFCNDHPMAYRLRNMDLVLLKIKVDVAWLKGTLYSDINAAAMNHHHGPGLKDLQRVKFTAVKRHYLTKDDDDFGPHQAEVLVKTHVPSKYIVNLDDPIELDFD